MAFQRPERTIDSMPVDAAGLRAAVDIPATLQTLQRTYAGRETTRIPGLGIGRARFATAGPDRRNGPFDGA
jgi:hypothetical protein